MSAMGEELSRLMRFEERHRRLLARLGLVVAATAVIDVVGTVAIYFLERHAHQTDVKTFGDALFFTTVQLLTVSSQLKNPLTAGGRVVDVLRSEGSGNQLAGGGPCAPTGHLLDPGRRRPAVDRDRYRLRRREG